MIFNNLRGSQSLPVAGLTPAELVPWKSPRKVRRSLPPQQGDHVGRSHAKSFKSRGYPRVTSLFSAKQGGKNYSIRKTVSYFTFNDLREISGCPGIPILGMDYSDQAKPFPPCCKLFLLSRPLRRQVAEFITLFLVSNVPLVSGAHRDPLGIRALFLQAWRVE